MNKSYSEKLRDPRWQKKRLKALEKAGWKCQDCGDGKNTLHVHHLKYYKNPWDVPYKCLKVLCEECHSIYHIIENENKRMGGYNFANNKNVAIYFYNIIAVSLNNNQVFNKDYLTKALNLILKKFDSNIIKNDK